jgi:hypothetical protein
MNLICLKSAKNKYISSLKGVVQIFTANFFIPTRFHAFLCCHGDFWETISFYSTEKQLLVGLGQETRERGTTSDCQSGCCTS